MAEMVEILTKEDLPESLQAAELIDLMLAGANATAIRLAPCLTWDGTTPDKPAPTPEQIAEAKLILIGMIKRWTEAGSGAFQAQTAGPFSVQIDTRQKSGGYRPWPSEITDLEALCSGTKGKAFAIETAPFGGPLRGHADICGLVFGSTYCDCGADLTAGRGPLYGSDESEPYGGL